MWLDDPMHGFAAMLIIGAVAGAFLYLDGRETFTWARLLIRMGASAMIGGAAAATPLLVERANIITELGVACLLGSFGTDRLGKIVQRVFRREVF